MHPWQDAGCQIVSVMLSRMSRRKTYRVDSAIGKGSKASNIGNGVEFDLSNRSSARDSSGSQSDDALCKTLVREIIPSSW